MATKVLVIEDDRSVRETLGMVLETYEYDVQLVDGSDTAFKALEKTWPDVMLLDLSLVGISGEELYGLIRSRFGSAPPTVVLSAVQHGEARVRHLEGVKFLAKPYTLDQLIDVLQDAAESHSAA